MFSDGIEYFPTKTLCDKLEQNNNIIGKLAVKTLQSEFDQCRLVKPWPRARDPGAQNHESKKSKTKTKQNKTKRKRKLD